MRKSAKFFLAGAAVALTAGIATVLTLKEMDDTYFECPYCGEKFAPDLKEYIMSPHTPRRRRLKCPVCGNHAWARKITMVEE